jgi:hypothetical protein
MCLTTRDMSGECLDDFAESMTLLVYVFS